MKKFYRERAKKKIKVQTVRVKYTSALPGRADSAAERLRVLNEILKSLFSDENFITLLQAESMTEIPEYLGPLVEGARDGYEIR